MTRPPTLARDRRQPRGFTFVEVLFAIIILGIGSIMLAGMLPVAIKQTSDTRNEITGQSVCEAGYAYVRVVAASAIDTLPATSPPAAGAVRTLDYPAGPPAVVIADSPGRLVPLTRDMIVANQAGTYYRLGPYASIAGSRVFTSDPRFQWTAFFGRDTNASRARLVIVATHLANVDGGVDRYGPQATPNQNVSTLPNEQINANNGPFLLTGEIREGGALEADTIRFPFSGNSIGVNLGAAETGPIESGAFVIVASQPAVGTDTARPQRNNGRVFRLAARRTDLEATDNNYLIYDLQPGFDLPPAGPGADGRINTADDELDGSFDPNGSYKVSDTGTPVGGSAAQFWMIGRGLRNPTAPYDARDNPYLGPVQDVSVLSVDVPLNQ